MSGNDSLTMHVEFAFVIAIGILYIVTGRRITSAETTYQTQPPPSFTLTLFPASTFTEKRPSSVGRDCVVDLGF